MDLTGYEAYEVGNPVVRDRKACYMAKEVRRRIYYVVGAVLGNWHARFGVGKSRRFSKRYPYDKVDCDDTAAKSASIICITFN